MEEFLAKKAIEMASSTTESTGTLMNRLLGPTADYLGTELRDYVTKRRENATKILENADKKLGDQVNQAGGIPPRVVKEVIEEGSWNDDALAAEYYGGVLASSYSGVSRDDRGAMYAQLVSSMTSFQLFSHYVFYTMLRGWFNRSPGLGSQLPSPLYRGIWIHTGTFYFLLGQEESVSSADILSDVWSGLRQLDLIGDVSIRGEVSKLRGFWPDAEEDGLVVAPSTRGITLYLFAAGLGQHSMMDYFSPHFEIPVPIQFPVLGDAKAVGLRQKIHD